MKLLFESWKKFLLENDDLLLEGTLEDLKTAYPSVNFDGFKPKFLNWLKDRFLEPKRVEEVHPIEDAIETLKKFVSKEQAIAGKWVSNADFKKAVLEDPITKDIKSPTDITNLTADQLEALMVYSERKKTRFELPQNKEIGSDELVGKFGEWSVYLPKTRESSCQIAGYDEKTMSPKTTWCTARTQGSNLFYNYVGRKDQNIFLFYVMKDNPKTDTDWLSIGWINGKPVFDGHRGGVTVNRANYGIQRDEFESLLGDKAGSALAAMEAKIKEYDGVHPAKQMMIQAAKDPKVFVSITSGLSEEERTDLAKQIMEFGPSPEVLALLAKDKDVDIRRAVARNEATPPEVLALLAKDRGENVMMDVIANRSTPPETLALLAKNKSFRVRSNVAKNQSTPPNVLASLAKDEDISVRLSVARNETTPPETLALLAKSKDSAVRANVADNSSTPPEVLALLAKDDDVYVRFSVARNETTPLEILALLAKDGESRVKVAVAENETIPIEMLVSFAKDEDTSVREKVAIDRRMPPETLALMAKDKSGYVREIVARNRLTPPESLALLAKDKNYEVRRSVAGNRSTPPEVLASLFKGEKREIIRFTVAANRSTPPEALASLAKDKSSYVRKNVALNPSTPPEIAAKLKAKLRLDESRNRRITVRIRK